MSIFPLSWTSPAMQAKSLVSTRMASFHNWFTLYNFGFCWSHMYWHNVSSSTYTYTWNWYTSILCVVENDLSHSTVEGLYLGKRIKYELYAICNHMGSITFGHYTALVKHYATDHWYLCNDSRYAHTVLCVGLQLCGMCTLKILNFSQIKNQ